MVKTWEKLVIAQTLSGHLNHITSVLRPAAVTVAWQKSSRRLIFGYPVHSKGGAEGHPHARKAVVDRHSIRSLNQHHWRIIDETW